MQKVTIAYTDPFNVFDNIKNGLCDRLPLHNIHWSHGDRPVRTISTLDFSFVKKEQSSENQRKHQMLGVSSSAVLEILLVTCNDNDTYKSKIRQMIRSWVSGVAGSRDPTEWLVVLYIPPNSKVSSSSRRFKSPIFDKIKSDFNSGSKKDRCVLITSNLSSEISQAVSRTGTPLKEVHASTSSVDAGAGGADDDESRASVDSAISSIATSSPTSAIAQPTSAGQFQTPVNGTNGKLGKSALSRSDASLGGNDDYMTALNTCWRDFMSKLKDGLLDAFGRRVDAYSDEITKLYEQRSVMGWNFSKFFIMKEGLALTFENFNLYDDALIIYDELEKSFDPSSSFIKSVGFNGPVPTHLSNIDSQDARQKIMSNEMSLFDFHCYLFSRQAQILLCLSESANAGGISSLKAGELFLKLKSFINEMTNLLNANKKSPLDIAEWAFNIAQEYMDKTAYISKGAAQEVDEGKGEMELIMRNSVEQIALLLKGWKIQGPVVDISLTDGEENSLVQSEAESKAPQNSAILESISSIDAFHSYFKQITTAACTHFNSAKRMLTVYLLYAQLAVLCAQQNDFKQAAKWLEKTPYLESDRGWELLSTSLQVIYVNALRHLSRDKDLMIFLIQLLKQRKLLPENDIKNAMEDVTKISSKVNLTFNDDMLVQMEGISSLQASSDNYSLDIVIRSEFPQNLACSGVDLILMAKNTSQTERNNVNNNAQPAIVEPSRLVFSTKSFVLNPGVNTVTVSCKNFAEGVFAASRCSVACGKVKFVCTNLKHNVTMHTVPGNLHTAVSIPEFMELHKNILHFKILDGPKDMVVKKAAAMARTPHFTIQRATKMSENLWHLDYTAGAHCQLSDIEIATQLEYTVGDESFSHYETHHLNLGLPVSVTVSDFFKKKGLISKFTITPGRDEAIKIFDVSLSSSSSFSTSTNVKAPEPSLLLTGDAYTSFFVIRNESGVTEANPTKEEFLTLNIGYRFLREEIWIFFEKLLMESTILKRYIFLIKKQIFRFAKFDFEGYMNTRQLVINVEESDCNDLIAMVSESERAEFKEALNSALFDPSLMMNSLAHMGSEGVKSLIDSLVAHQLLIPMAVPKVDIVQGVEFILPEAAYFVKSQPLPLKVLFESDISWCGSNLHEETVNVSYDIVGGSDVWLLSGRRKGGFTVPMSSKTGRIKQEAIDITAIPLKSGKLALPKVMIQVSHERGLPFKVELDLRNNNQLLSVVDTESSFALSL